MTEFVIFDCDGVLVDSEPISNEVLIRDLADYGLSLSHEDCEALFVGGTMRGVFETAKSMGADLPSDWVARIYDRIYKRLAEGVPVVPGIPHLLDQLDRAGIGYCVASNGSLEKMRITLGQNGLWDRFEERIFSAHEEGVAKPDPGLFLIAAERNGARPEACIVIEDSRSGARAAAAAGMACLGYAPEGDGARLADLGATVIRSMGEVAAHLNLSA